MAVKLGIDVKPWIVPNFVIVGSMSLSLDVVEPDVLAQLCDEFRAEVFRKAKKADPAK